MLLNNEKISENKKRHRKQTYSLMSTLIREQWHVNHLKIPFKGVMHNPAGVVSHFLLKDKEKRMSIQSILTAGDLPQ